MSGIKINYEKSEVFTVGLDVADQQTVVEVLSCKLGVFPMKYLDLPVSDCKITKAPLKYVTDKIEKRLST